MQNVIGVFTVKVAGKFLSKELVIIHQLAVSNHVGGNFLWRLMGIRKKFRGQKLAVDFDFQFEKKNIGDKDMMDFCEIRLKHFSEQN